MNYSTPRPVPRPYIAPQNIHALAGKARRDLEEKVLAGPTVKGMARLVILELFGYFRGKAVCWPGNGSLAKKTGVCPRTICNALNRLENAGVIKTLDDSRVGSHRRIILLEHPDSKAALAELESSPHVRVSRCRVGRPRDSHNSQSTLHQMQADLAPNAISEIAPDTSETVNRSSAEPKPPLGGEKIQPLNGERSTPVLVGTPLTASELAIKQMADEGWPGMQAEWDLICRARMRAAGHLEVPPLESIDQPPRIAPAAGQGAPGVEYLARLKPGAPSYVFDQAVAVLCRTFESTDDRDYRPAYQGIVGKVRRGVLSTAVVVHAFERACLPSARNPGRVFAFNVERRIHGVSQANEMRPVQP